MFSANPPLQGENCRISENSSSVSGVAAESLFLSVCSRPTRPPPLRVTCRRLLKTGTRPPSASQSAPVVWTGRFLMSSPCSDEVESSSCSGAQVYRPRQWLLHNRSTCISLGRPRVPHRIRCHLRYPFDDDVGTLPWTLELGREILPIIGMWRHT